MSLTDSELLQGKSRVLLISQLPRPLDRAELRVLSARCRLRERIHG